jgi:hypothetical protein
MVGLVPVKKSDSGRQAAIILPISLNLTTAKEFDHIGGESASCSHQFVSVLELACETIPDLSQSAVSSQPAHIM